jgi:glycosyltransferase involved in cell wall biosynthesis
MAVANAKLIDFSLSNCDVLLPNGTSEGESLQSRCANVAPWRVIPNGIRIPTGGNPTTSERVSDVDFVLFVGRIESRKNLVPVVEAVRELGLAFVAIGSLDAEPGYAARVINAAGPNAKFFGPMAPERLPAVYQQARVHVMASWFETPGLASLEAALEGCPIVTTDRGTTREYFADLAWYCDPTSKDSIRRAIAEAWDSTRNHELADRIRNQFTWNHTARATETVYHSLCGLTRS